MKARGGDELGGRRVQTSVWASHYVCSSNGAVWCKFERSNG
ncbi:hypothetical protein ACFFK0_27475 [Paenibacillus chartarius]|uniref:Uncharacterized protein n=1 Tax=Paenibacillus chartarius TaxID=747481 RepID=A0ABV6DU32_9BACL